MNSFRKNCYGIFAMAILLVNNIDLLAQCDTGTEPSCTCDTAPLLCTINDLDNYTYSMTDYQHPEDGPDGSTGDLCNGVMSVPNNPTWFSFVSWCTSLTIEFNVSNCSTGDFGSRGIQAAVYPACNTNNALACNAGTCNFFPNDITLVVNGMIPGEVYHVMVDGCGGSACDIEIDVVTDCGINDISPWPDPIDGELIVCAPQNEDYTVDLLPGAEEYYWYLDGTQIATGVDLNTVNINWDTPGVYELCVDVSNEPCIPETSDPLPNCIMIEVLDSFAEAGDMSANPNPTCPDETIAFSTVNYNDQTDYDQWMFVTNAAGEIVKVVMGPMGDFTHDLCDDFTVYSYNYYNQGTNIPPVVGTQRDEYICNNCLCDIDSLVISFEDDTAPVFTNPPADLTLTCLDLLPPIMNLDFTDNCIPDDNVAGTETGSPTTCDGGTITREWTATDLCGNEEIYTQTITIDPTPLPAYVDVPAALTLSCADPTYVAPDLVITNNALGQCLIEDMVTPTADGTLDGCGNTITYTWSYSDPCGRVIEATQTVTQTPPPDAVFLSPPPDITLECADFQTYTIPDLTVDNGESGPCQIMDVVTGTSTGNIEECGGTLIDEWEYTDLCGRTITHMRTITVNPATIAVFATPPPDITVDCENVPPADISLGYDNGETGICQIMGSELPTRVGTVNPCGTTLQDVWEFTDDCGRTIMETRDIVVTEAPQAQFTSLPGDVTLDCSDIMANTPLLAYDNGLTTPCAINGSVAASRSGTYDGCGGNLVHTWIFTDNCGRTINHSQNVTVTPAADPSFVDLPADITIDCGDTFDPIMNLDWTNGESGNCELSGSSPVMSMTNSNIITYTWEFLHPCTNDLITHSQEVFFRIEPAIDIDPKNALICEGDSYDLSAISVVDINNTNITVTYHDSDPPSPGNEISPIVSPGINTIYYIQATNEFGCTDYVPFPVDVTVPPNAGDDNTLEACQDGVNINLFDYLSTDANLNGVWLDTDGVGVNLADPTNISFLGTNSGSFNLTYQVPGLAPCPDDEAIITVDLSAEVEFEILEVSCDEATGTYFIIVRDFGNIIQASEGDVSTFDSESVIVQNIPLTSDVLIEAFDINFSCFNDVIVTPPNCDCPDVPNPSAPPLSRVCIEDLPTSLTVTVQSGLTANWYENGGTVPLATGTTEYQHMQATPGIYTYQVEAVDPANDCTSQKVTVTIEVLSPPLANPVNYDICDNGLIGMDTFDLASVISDITPIGTNKVYFFADSTQTDNLNDTLAYEYVLSAGEITIYSLVIDGFGCRNIGTVDLKVNPLPTVDIIPASEICIGDGDGSITLDNITTLGPYQFLLNGQDKLDTTFFPNLSSGTYSIELIDSTGCSISGVTAVEPGFEFVDIQINSECDNNGTLSDSDDDSYTITINVSNNQGNAPSQSFSVLIGTDVYGPFDYGVESTIQLSADGDTKTLIISDLTDECETERQVGPLNSCSTLCQLSLDSESSVCSDNGTPLDPNDDFYSFELEVSAINGSANFQVLVNGDPRFSGEYGQTLNFQLPADGSMANIQVVDGNDTQCFVDLTSVALLPCSNGCALNIVDLSSTCDDNDTPLDPIDDIAEHLFSVQSFNSQGNQFEAFVNNQSQGIFDYNVEVSLSTPADGQQYTIECIDLIDATCSTSTTVSVNACSSTCDMNVSFDISDCDNNGTNEESDDDFYNLTFTVEGSGNAWTADFNALNGNYNEVVSVNNLLISEGEIVITITDSEEALCNQVINITPPPPCSGCEQSIEPIADFRLDCTNQSTSVTPVASETGIYEWTRDGTVISDEESITVTTEGNYTVTILFADGCSVSESFIVTKDDAFPTVNAGPDILLGCIDTIATLDGSLSSSGPDITYIWTDVNGSIVSTDVVFTTETTGTFFLQVVDAANNCESGLDEVRVEKDDSLPSNVIYANPTNILDCQILTIQLSTDSEDNTIYNWQFGEDIALNSPTFDVSREGTINMIAIDTINGCENSGMITVSDFTQYPIIELSVMDTLDCDTDRILLSTEGSQISENVNVTWADLAGNELSTDPNLSVTTAGTYVVQLLDTENGCENSDTITVESFEVDIEVTIDPVIEVNVDQLLTLRPVVNVPLEDIATIIWTPEDNLSCTDCLEPQISVPVGETTYTVTVIDINGCIGTASVTLRAKKEGVITIPNIISTSTGGNGQFTVYANEVIESIDQLSIFDRWGNKVFSNENFAPNDPSLGWNGRLNGQLVEQGVYVYLVRYTDVDGNTQIITGDVTVLW